MERTAFAPGKIILSGEYAMALAGGRGIAMPSPLGLTARFEEDLAKESLFVNWPGIGDLWKAYIGRIVAECAMAKGDILRGRLTIENKIPLGKGMGSSTACVIAVCKALMGERCRATTEKTEDRLNPGHSGMDFAVIWHAKPILFKKGEKPKTLKNPIRLPHPVLIDTGTPNEPTHELVAWVKSRMDEPAVAQALQSIGDCTERLRAGESPLQVFPDHHRAQVALGVVTKPVQKMIEEIEQSGGAAKVIGAGGKTGGSGMVLAIHHSMGDLHACVPGNFRVVPM